MIPTYFAVEWTLACRPGFEPEAAAEGRVALAAAGLDAMPETATGLVRFRFADPVPRATLPAPRDLVFARAAWAAFARLDRIDPKDRLSPLLAALDGVPAVADAWVEVPD